MSQREVTGTITPAEAIGVYDQITDYNGKSRWKHQSEDWWIAWEGSTFWMIQNHPDTAANKSWLRMDSSELGDYVINSETTGTATVTEYVADTDAKILSRPPTKSRLDYRRRL